MCVFICVYSWIHDWNTYSVVFADEEKQIVSIRLWSLFSHLFTFNELSCRMTSPAQICALCLIYYCFRLGHSTRLAQSASRIVWQTDSQQRPATPGVGHEGVMCPDWLGCCLFCWGNCDQRGKVDSSRTDSWQWQLQVSWQLPWHLMIWRGVWCTVHGWEIAVILRNFRKTKLSKSKFLSFFFFFFFFFFFLLYFNMYTMCDSTTFALWNRQILLSGILRHFARQAAIFFCTRMIQTQSLEFVAETRILAKMKIENRGKNFFPQKTNSQAYFVF